jgi:hypothetical protein
VIGFRRFVESRRRRRSTATESTKILNPQHCDLVVVPLFGDILNFNAKQNGVGR